MAGNSLHIIIIAGLLGGLPAHAKRIDCKTIIEQMSRTSKKFAPRIKNSPPSDTLRLRLSEGDSREFYRSAFLAFTKDFSVSEVLELANWVADSRRLSKSDYSRLTDIRRRAKTLRFMYVAFSQDHSPPNLLNRFIILMGKLKDALKLGDKIQRKKAAGKLADFLVDYNTADLLSPIYRLSPIRQHEFTIWRNAQLVELKNLLKHKHMTAKSFHDIRKRFHHQVELIGCYHRFRPRAEDESLLKLVSKINNSLENIHDAMMKATFQGNITYNKTKIRFPEELRKMLRDLVNSFG